MDRPWKEAILDVLRGAEESMSAAEIADEAVASGLRTSVGATPSQTVHSNISTSIKTEGDASPFVRIAKGQYAVRISGDGHAETSLPTPNIQGEIESIAGGIQALGMYWVRDLVQWKRMPKLLGRQQIGAQPVNVSKQIGLYLLYDGREVIYAGRTTNRPIGIRLYEHTQDRLRARWNRFSWFGMYPINDDGTISEEVPPIDANSMIAALEAMAIEALEPRQNRKRGDDFSGVEFIQELDPEIERERKLALIEDLKESL